MATNYAGLEQGLGTLVKALVGRGGAQEKGRLEAEKQQMENQYLQARVLTEQAQGRKYTGEASREAEQFETAKTRRTKAVQGLYADAVRGDPVALQAVQQALDTNGDVLGATPEPYRRDMKRTLEFVRLLDLGKDSTPDNLAQALRDVQDRQQGTFKVQGGYRINDVSGETVATPTALSQVQLDKSRAAAAALGAKSGAAADYARANASNASAAYTNDRRANPTRYRGGRKDEGFSTAQEIQLATKDYEAQYPTDKFSGKRPEGAPLPSPYIEEQIRKRRAARKPATPTAAPTTAPSTAPASKKGAFKMYQDKQGRRAKVYADGSYEVVQ